jgi:hypothetical protein
MAYAALPQNVVEIFNGIQTSGSLVTDTASSIAWMNVVTLYVKKPTSIGISSKCIRPYCGAKILDHSLL